MSSPPLIVVDGSREAFDAVLDELRASRTVLFDGAPEESARVPRDAAPPVVVMDLGARGDAAEAVLAAVRGFGLVAYVPEGGGVLELLVEDLRRLGDVVVLDRAPDASPAVHQEVSLSDDQLRLLDMLAEGTSLGEAAVILHLSRRTAARRLAEAKAALGVSTTAEAVIRTRRA